MSVTKQNIIRLFHVVFITEHAVLCQPDFFFFLPRSSFGLNYDNYILIFTHTHPRQPPPLPCVRTNTNGNYVLWAWFELYSLGSVPGIECTFFSLHNKKATSTLYSFIALGKSRMVRLLVWAICPSWNGWAWDFQAQERSWGALSGELVESIAGTWLCEIPCESLLWAAYALPVWFLHLGNTLPGG